MALMWAACAGAVSPTQSGRAARSHSPGKRPHRPYNRCSGRDRTEPLSHQPVARHRSGRGRHRGDSPYNGRGRFGGAGHGSWLISPVSSQRFPVPEDSCPSRCALRLKSHRTRRDGDGINKALSSRCWTGLIKRKRGSGACVGCALCRQRVTRGGCVWRSYLIGTLFGTLSR